uniref:DUF7358 domain-containing protein n=1 Tax=Leersia perrieri TaxID=77586 RepID=A0A0D9W6I5_9ORYZ
MRPLFRIRGVRRMSAALAAVNAAAVAVGAAAEWMGVMSTERCERRREVAAAGAAVAVLAAVRIAVMVGAAHAQEVTAVAIVASGADGGEGRPTQEFAKRETRSSLAPSSRDPTKAFLPPPPPPLLFPCPPPTTRESPLSMAGAAAG